MALDILCSKSDSKDVAFMTLIENIIENEDFI